jgi:hypothetical protein
MDADIIMNCAGMEDTGFGLTQLLAAGIKKL